MWQYVHTWPTYVMESASNPAESLSLASTASNAATNTLVAPIHSITTDNNLKQGNQRWQTSPAPPGGLGHCQTGMCMSNFMMIGWEMAEMLHIEISWKHVSVTYDLDLWPKILKIFVSHGVPIRNMYAKFHNDRLRNGWDITLWNFAKTRTNKHKHTNTQTNRHGHYNTSPSPYGGRGNNIW